MGWEINYKVYVKGKTQDVAYMREKLSAIMKNQDKLGNEDWLRELFADKYDAVSSAFAQWPDDFCESLANQWDGYSVNEGLMQFDSSDYDDDEETEFNDYFPKGEFADALDAFFRCLGVDSRGIATGRSDYSGSNLTYYAFLDDLDNNGSWGYSEYLDAYEAWKNAEINYWLLPDGAPEKEQARQKEAEAKMVFEYACENLDMGEEKLAVTTDAERELLSLVYDRFSGWITEIDFTGAKKDVQGLPENIAEAVKNGEVTLNFIKEDKSVKKALELIWENPKKFLKIPEKIKTEKFCLAAVQQIGRALEYVPEALRTKAVCLAAVQHYGQALQYVPEALKTEAVCLAAVQQDGYALEYVPEALKTEAMCLVAVQQDGSALEYVPEASQTEAMCLAAVQNRGWALRYVPEALKTEALCLAAVQQNGRALEYVPEASQTEALCLAAVQQDGSALQYVPEALKAKVKAAAGN